MAVSRSRTDRVLLPTRVVAVAIIPFLVVAFAVLVPAPGDTKRLFAWQIKSTMTAMTLGSVYLGGAYFFFRVVRSSKWHSVAGGFLSVGTFASLMGIATILHWNVFIHSNVAFWLWTGLYFTTPFIIFAVFLRNQREYAPAGAGDVMISRAAGSLIGAGGCLAVLMSAFLFVFPTRAADIWPWTLTPLTARAMGAIFALGIAEIGAFRERRWSAARVLLQVAGVMLVLILIAGARAHREFDSSNPLTWLFAVGFVAATLATVVLYVQMESRARR
jgi:hypothetical protein